MYPTGESNDQNMADHELMICIMKQENSGEQMAYA
jgi:hypothetical protein